MCLSGDKCPREGDEKPNPILFVVCAGSVVAAAAAAAVIAYSVVRTLHSTERTATKSQAFRCRPLVASGRGWLALGVKPILTMT